MRSGGLDYLVGGEVRSAVPAVLTPGSVDEGHCRINNVDSEHLRGGTPGIRSSVDDMDVHHDERAATSPTGRQRDGEEQGEKFVRTSLDCQWPTTGQSI